MSPEEPSSFITIARVTRARGNKGEVLVDSFTDYPDRFDSLEEVWLEFEGRRPERTKLDFTWEHKGRRIFKFEGYDTIGAAQSLVGCFVQIPEDEAVRLPEGTYFDHDLIGCSIENSQGEQLGAVVYILRISGNNQLVVRNRSKEFMIPAVGSICTQVSIKEKRIIVDLPEGLMDLDS